MVSGSDERADGSPSHGGLESFDIDLGPDDAELLRGGLDAGDDDDDFEGIDEDPPPDDDDDGELGEPTDNSVKTRPSQGDEADAQVASSQKDVMFGAVLADRYRVLELIGKGGMGKVYLAEHVAIRKKVAIKVLSQSYCHRPDQVKRFLREAQAASTIEHDNVIDIFDYGETDNGSVFFAMELLEGLDLGGVLREDTRLPWPRARPIFLQIARALQAAHDHGVIHRDIKPENCFLLQRGEKVDFVKVLDFGIAKVVDEERKNAHTLTQAGALIGTPEYMAPEQVQGGAADPRMDIYSVGCIMYQVLTGELPFEDSTMFGVLTKQVSEDPIPLRVMAPGAGIPAAVEEVVLKAMEKSREDRYQTMGELVDAIEAIGLHPDTGELPIAASTSSLYPHLAPPPQQNLQRVVIGLGAAVVLLCGLVAYFAFGGDDSDDPSVATQAVETQVAGPSDAGASTAASSAGVTSEEPVTTDDGATSGGETTTDETGSEGATTSDSDESASGTTDEDGTAGASAVSQKKTKKAKKKPPPDPNLPKELDLFRRNAGIRTVSESVKKCRASTGVPAGTQVKVTIKVSGRTGKVLSATPTTSNAAGKCVAKAVKKAKFPKFQKSTQKFSQAFRL